MRQHMWQFMVKTYWTKL
ncbi:unnamed protein product [Linum tenue]|uniref:Uncharacterized protein n=1 Tax=Linum tenue TaxID=586396 RepID=A0AAV0JIP0_9ROSI|nr:unnamed protein product [Linum tenue]